MSTENREANCEPVRKQFALLLYGELNFDQEEQVETHLDTCAECRQALAKQQSLHEAVSAAAVTASPALLEQSRAQLSELLDHERTHSNKSWWRDLAGAFQVRWANPFAQHGGLRPVFQPILALALVATGFVGARMLPDTFAMQGSQAGVLGNARVRNVAADGDGRVRIIIDQTQERTIRGKMSDQDIKALLMSAAKDAPDADLRAQTVTILSDANSVGEVHDAYNDDVRQALLFALANDHSENVRAMAMKGLRRYAEDPAVQGALAQVLLAEGNARVRTDAIDMILSTRRGPVLDRHIIGALQELMDREDNGYVRDQCRRMLEALKASPETY